MGREGRGGVNSDAPPEPFFLILFSCFVCMLGGRGEGLWEEGCTATQPITLEKTREGGESAQDRYGSSGPKGLFVPKERGGVAHLLFSPSASCSEVLYFFFYLSRGDTLPRKTNCRGNVIPEIYSIRGEGG